jgi:hypothetical protein
MDAWVAVRVAGGGGASQLLFSAGQVTEIPQRLSGLVGQRRFAEPHPPGHKTHPPSSKNSA